MHAIVRDIRYAFRSLRKSPLLSVTAILALTLGIALTTTMFSIIYGSLLKGLPFDHGRDIVALTTINPANQNNNGGGQNVSVSDYADYQAQSHSFDALGADYSGTVNISGTEKPERFDGAFISANTFDILRVHPILGSGFVEDEGRPGGGQVAVLGYDMWHDRYAADPAAVGKIIRANGVPYTIIGVMPPGFTFPDRAQIWLPLQFDAAATKRGQGQSLNVFGRLKTGVSIDQANADVVAIAKRLANDYKESNGNLTAAVQPFVDGDIGKPIRAMLYAMLGAVFFVLMIACANVANLLLDRAAHRTKEVGIRTALGASRAAVIRQFLAEASALSVVGAVCGVALAHVGVDLFNRAIVNVQVPFYIDIRIYPIVLVFTIGVAVLSTLLSGAIPAYQSSRVDINEVLKDETRGASSFRIGKITKGLVIVEIALSCALLVCAGLTIKSVAGLRNVDTGFETKSVFTARIGFPAPYADTVMEEQFYEQVAQRVAALPGVEAASISAGLPGAQQGIGGSTFGLEEKSYLADKDYPTTATTAVSPGFFSTLRIPLIRGRLFTSADRQTTMPVAVVSQSFVRTFIPTGDAIGKRIRFGASKSTQPWVTIVGIIPDIFTGDPNTPKPPLVIRPLQQAHSSFVYISARTEAPPLSLAGPVRDLVASMNPDIPIYWPLTLDDAIARNSWFYNVFGSMFMIFGGIALALAAIGLYAVMSFSVSRRTREVGIRIALGAQARDVVGLILRQGALQIVIGMGAGLFAAYGLSLELAPILYNVKPHDPGIFGVVGLVLTLTGLLACFIPATRATRVDPLGALRSE